MNFQIKNHWSGAVMFECELSAEVAGMSYALQMGFAVKKAIASRANLYDANLSHANLSGADLYEANLSRADLSGANLSGADWMPKIANIHSTVYAAASQPNSLNMITWHCGTTHCRSGWVVTLAGQGGRVLEGVYGTSAAAALIYQSSDPTLELIPDFFCDDETALADMKRLADMEAARS